MRITRLDAGGLDLTPKTGNRSPGIHVSDVIRDISNTVIKVGQREKYDDLSPAEKQRLGNYAAGGWAWEQIIRRGLLDAGLRAGDDPERFQRPGECKLDNLYGTPDWFDTRDWENVEFKATWRSSTRPLDPDFWEWTAQFKAYCKFMACQSTLCHVFWVNGDYRESGPQYEPIRFEFSKLEIDDNWSMIVNHANEMRRGQSGVRTRKNTKK